MSSEDKEGGWLVRTTRMKLFGYVMLDAKRLEQRKRVIVQKG